VERRKADADAEDDDDEDEELLEPAEKARKASTPSSATANSDD
jgi:hypothetical protein